MLRRPRLALLLGVSLLTGCTASPSAETDRTLRAAVEAVLADYPEATVAVAVRDPATDTRFDINTERVFHAASTMKVPVMIEAFRRAGTEQLGDSLTVRNEFRSIVDGSPFAITDDSDDTLYERIGERVPVQALLRRMITHSSNLATNLLIEHATADSVQQTIERLGTERMRVLRGVEDLKAFDQGLSNTATAADLATLLLALMEGRAVSPSADSAMVAILLDQSFDAMIPAGLPTDVRVAHKTGEITRIHHDAAIVYPDDAPPYVLVVLTEGVDDHDRSARLGAALARVVHTTLRGPAPLSDD
ncbi:MAG: serine hydrolase [Rhodothermales bacterium]